MDKNRVSVDAVSGESIARRTSRQRVGRNTRPPEIQTVLLWLATRRAQNRTFCWQPGHNLRVSMERPLSWRSLLPHVIGLAAEQEFRGSKRLEREAAEDKVLRRRLESLRKEASV